MTFFPADFSIYTLIIDSLLTISLIVGFVSTVKDIRKNNEIARQKRMMERHKTEKGFYDKKEFKTFFTDRNKKLPKKYIDIITGINNGLPEIYYDNGFFNVGWHWYISNSVIILIEKNILRYTFRVWKEVDGKWLWSRKKEMSNLEKDEDLRSRILSVKDKKE